MNSIFMKTPYNTCGEYGTIKSDNDNMIVKGGWIMNTTETRLMLDKIMEQAEERTGKKFSDLSFDEQMEYLVESFETMKKNLKFHVYEK